jgi:hypothetical protein
MASSLPQGKEYKIKHEGQAIVCGSAPCLLKEYMIARANMPDAKVFVVNESSYTIRGDFLVSYHAEKFDEFKKKSLNKKIISLTGKGYRSPEEEKQIDFRFDNIRIGATSVGDAIQIAKQMGFNEIVIVGAPMNGGDGYYNSTSMQHDGCPRFGSKEYLDTPEQKKVSQNQEMLKVIAKDLPMVKSMSGFSAEVFGKPLWGL